MQVLKGKVDRKVADSEFTDYVADINPQGFVEEVY